MDFLIGILLVAVVILILYNFTSISLSNSPNSGNCSNQNYLISSMQQSMLQPNMNIPQPILANSPVSVNGKAPSNEPGYDYQKYFFVA
jgi:hypothetical protein